MSQENKPFAHRGDFQHLIPLASTGIKSGDYVVMPRNSDPISRARLGLESRISPVAAAYDAQWGVGIVDSDFSTNTVGATLYATPTAQEALPVLRRGCFRLAVKQTGGKVGDLVMYSSGASGAQVFTINNFRRDVAVGTIARDFSGATANDTQLVELFEKPLTGRDIYFWMSNRVVAGCRCVKHSVAGQGSTQIRAGVSGDKNLFMIKGKMNSVASKTDFTMGLMAPGGQSAVRFYWVAVKLSSTGGAAAFMKATCSGIFSAFASWTNSGISAGMMIPITWNSNMVRVALVIAWSATGVTIGNDRILNDGHNLGLPNGTQVADHGTWYL
jgi:hypothetical protein